MAIQKAKFWYLKSGRSCCTISYIVTSPVLKLVALVRSTDLKAKERLLAV